MKKSTLYSLIAATGIATAAPGIASAAITGLNPSSAVNGCIAGAGTYPSCTYGTTVVSGSYFAFDGNNDGQISAAEKDPITELGTLNFNDLTVAYSGNTSVPATPNSDSFSFLGATGVDYLTSPIIDNGDGTLNMSGWTISWNGLAAIPMGGDASQGDTSLATISCGACNIGDAFTLDYTAHAPLNDPSNLGGTLYVLHLEGTVANVSSVPLPAATWLFGSGLLSLLGITKRRRNI